MSAGAAWVCAMVPRGFPRVPVAACRHGEWLRTELHAEGRWMILGHQVRMGDADFR